MRQAGRYLPAYREVRSKTSFLGLCKTPELACEVTLQPIDEFGMDAAILFCDILVPLEGMGMRLEFTDKGPKLPEPVQTKAAVDALTVPDPHDRVPFVMDAVSTIRKALDGRVPLIGFAGAPFTMACYAVEGGGSQNYYALKKLLFSEPKVAHDLLDKISRFTVSYLVAQAEAGAQAVQLFDSWAGILAPPDLQEFSLRYAKRVISELKASPVIKDKVPVIYFAKGCMGHLEEVAKVGADVLGLDWSIDIAEARRRVPGVAVQGNMDPSALFLPDDELAARVKRILAAGAEAGPGHVFNLGHGIFPQASPERVRVLVDTVRNSA